MVFLIGFWLRKSAQSFQHDLIFCVAFNAQNINCGIISGIRSMLQNITSLGNNNRLPFSSFFLSYLFLFLSNTIFRFVCLSRSTIIAIPFSKPNYTLSLVPIPRFKSSKNVLIQKHKGLTRKSFGFFVILGLCK